MNCVFCKKPNAKRYVYQCKKGNKEKVEYYLCKQCANKHPELEKEKE
jgi:protein-arginine kinase activator protein McsA